MGMPRNEQRKKIQFAIQWLTVRRWLCSNVENGNECTSISCIQSSWERVQFVEMLRSIKECIYVPVGTGNGTLFCARRQKDRRKIRTSGPKAFMMMMIIGVPFWRTCTWHTRCDPCLSADCDAPSDIESNHNDCARSSTKFAKHMASHRDYDSFTRRAKLCCNVRDEKRAWNEIESRGEKV